MLDLQNVKEITIPEGDVKTIHDDNGSLLWGKISYTTKYSGDIVQDGLPTPDAPVSVEVVTGTQSINLSDGTNNKDYVIQILFHSFKILHICSGWQLSDNTII